MSAFSGETQKYVGFAVCAAATRDTSYGVGLADVHRVTVHCGLKNNPISATGTYPYATAAPTVEFSVRVGPTTDPATAELTGSTLAMGATAAGNLSNWDVIQIGIVATAANVLSSAHGKTVTIMGKQYTISTAASSTVSTVLPISATVIDGFGTALDAAVARDFPELEISVGASASNINSRYLRYKNVGEGKISASVTAQAALDATVSAPFVVGLEQHGAISFQPAHVVATNSSYTSFSVRVDGGATADQHRSAVAVIEPKRSGLISNTAKIGVAT